MSEAVVRKCVVPAAGLGTRFLPATKAVPKEMLPIVDTPTLQYIVEESVNAGIEDVILINGRGKAAIEDHFDLSVELEAVLKSRGKDAEYLKLRAISEMANIVSVRQKEPLGLGHAVLCAKSLVGDAPFAVILGDDLIDPDGHASAIAQLIKAYNKYKKGVVALMEVPASQTHMYGIAAGEPLDDPDAILITRIVEKPKSDPPSNLAVIGRYVLPPSIFGLLEKQEKGVGGEIQLTDALAKLRETEGLVGYRFKGRRYDAGDKVGYVQANIAYAMKRDDMRGPLLEYMRQLVKESEGK